MEYNYIEKRYNVMGLSSIEAFAGIKGGMNGNCKDVYFLRAIGANHTFLKDVEHMDEVQTGRMRLGQCVYNRVGAFPKNIGADAAALYMNCWQKWVDAGRTRLYTKKLDENAGMGELLGAACKKVLEAYRSCNANLNDSIEKNFVVKLLYWLDELAYEYLSGWNPKQSMKFVAQCVVKEQEYFFCYLLTLLGIDVLLLQSEADIDEKLERLHLSKQLVLGEKGAAPLEAYTREKWAVGRSGSGMVSQGSGQVRAAAPSSQRPRVIIPPNHRGTAGRAGGNMGPGDGMSGNTGIDANSGGGTLGNAGENPDPGGGRLGSGGRNIGSGNGMSGNAGRNTNSGGGTAGSSPGSGAGASGSTPWDIRRPAAGTAGGGRTGMSAQNQAAAQELDFEELALRASSVVMIAIHDRNGDIMGSGSGIMIGREGYILTNDHVARGGKYYSVRIENDENMYKTDEIIKYNSLLDLAVIRIDRKLQPLPIYRGSRPLVRGQKVVAIGSPLGLFNSVSDGIISGFRRMNDVDMIHFTAPISHGSSGGAVLNMYGEVIGVSTAGIDEGQNINLAVGYEFINTFIRGFQ